MKNKKLQFDNPDSRIRYYELMLERSLDNIPEYALPPGYRFVFYRQGDRDSWIRIEQSAKEFSSYEQGLDAWNRYYGGREHTLLDRMVFAENAEGKKIATATAYYDISGRDQSGDAWLHWVAADREYQGRGPVKAADNACARDNAKAWLYACKNTDTDDHLGCLQDLPRPWICPGAAECCQQPGRVEYDKSTDQSSGIGIL